MSDTELNLECSDRDRKLCVKISDIVLTLSKAEKRGQDMYAPLKQIEGALHDIQDESLFTLYQRLVDGLENSNADTEAWADEYFAFILLLCNLLNEVRTRTGQDHTAFNLLNHLVPA
jgi:hypothetical protein